MSVSDIMTGNVISISEDEPVNAAARLMKRNNIGSLPVRDGRGKLKGIITDRDIVLRCVADGEDCTDMRVGEIMSRNLVTVDASDDTERAAEKMGRNRVRRLPVTEGGILVGMVALGDLARSGDYRMEAAESLSEISTNFRRT